MLYSSKFVPLHTFRRIRISWPYSSALRYTKVLLSILLFTTLHFTILHCELFAPYLPIKEGKAFLNFTIQD